MDIPDLVERIDRVGSATWEGDAWRHVSVGRSPLSGEGARINGGRWNPPNSFAVLYLGAEIATVIAEFERMSSRQGLDAHDFLPRTLHKYEVGLSRVLDLRTSTALGEVELSDASLIADDPSQCRAVGEAAFVAGREGVIAPSATGRGLVVAVFLEQLLPTSRVVDIESELWEDVPTLD